MSLINGLKQMVYSLPLNTGKPRRDKIAHFCEHHGIHIMFTPAKTTWYAIAPSAIRPWWLRLETLKTAENTGNRNRNIINEETEILDNA